MTADTAIDIGQQALWVTALVAGVPLLSALAAGLVIGILQAATQINEMTLSFVPKLAVLAISLFVGGGWMLGILMDFTRRLISSIPQVVG
jgi:flagellar biosynthetic protein FliQ